MSKENFDNFKELIDSWDLKCTSMLISKDVWDDILNIKYYYICY